MKFTVGDTVRITANTTGHGFAIGDLCLIIERKIGRVSATAEKVGTWTRYHISDDDAELVSEVVRSGKEDVHDKG